MAGTQPLPNTRIMVTRGRYEGCQGQICGTPRTHANTDFFPVRIPGRTERTLLDLSSFVTFSPQLKPKYEEEGDDHSFYRPNYAGDEFRTQNSRFGEPINRGGDVDDHIDNELVSEGAGGHFDESTWRQPDNFNYGSTQPTERPSTERSAGAGSHHQQPTRGGARWSGGGFAEPNEVSVTIAQRSATKTGGKRRRTKKGGGGGFCCRSKKQTPGEESPEEVAWIHKCTYTCPVYTVLIGLLMFCIIYSGFQLSTNGSDWHETWFDAVEISLLVLIIAEIAARISVQRQESDLGRVWIDVGIVLGFLITLTVSRQIALNGLLFPAKIVMLVTYAFTLLWWMDKVYSRMTDTRGGYESLQSRVRSHTEARAQVEKEVAQQSLIAGMGVGALSGYDERPVQSYQSTGQTNPQSPPAAAAAAGATSPMIKIVESEPLMDGGHAERTLAQDLQSEISSLSIFSEGTHTIISSVPSRQAKHEELLQNETPSAEKASSTSAGSGKAVLAIGQRVQVIPRKSKQVQRGEVLTDASSPQGSVSVRLFTDPGRKRSPPPTSFIVSRLKVISREPRMNDRVQANNKWGQVVSKKIRDPDSGLSSYHVLFDGQAKPLLFNARDLKVSGPQILRPGDTVVIDGLPGPHTYTGQVATVMERAEHPGAHVPLRLQTGGQVAMPGQALRRIMTEQRPVVGDRVELFGFSKMVTGGGLAFLNGKVGTVISAPRKKKAVRVLLDGEVAPVNVQTNHLRITEKLVPRRGDIVEVKATGPSMVDKFNNREGQVVGPSVDRGNCIQVPVFLLGESQERYFDVKDLVEISSWTGRTGQNKDAENDRADGGRGSFPMQPRNPDNYSNHSRALSANNTRANPSHSEPLGVHTNPHGPYSWEPVVESVHGWDDSASTITNDTLLNVPSIPSPKAKKEHAPPVPRLNPGITRELPEEDDPPAPPKPQQLLPLPEEEVKQTRTRSFTTPTPPTFGEPGQDFQPSLRLKDGSPGRQPALSDALPFPSHLRNNTATTRQSSAKSDPLRRAEQQHARGDSALPPAQRRRFRSGSDGKHPTPGGPGALRTGDEIQVKKHACEALNGLRGTVTGEIRTQKGGESVAPVIFDGELSERPMPVSNLQRIPKATPRPGDAVTVVVPLKSLETETVVVAGEPVFLKLAREIAVPVKMTSNGSEQRWIFSRYLRLISGAVKLGDRVRLQSSEHHRLGPQLENRLGVLCGRPDKGGFVSVRLENDTRLTRAKIVNIDLVREDMTPRKGDRMVVEGIKGLNQGTEARVVDTANQTSSSKAGQESQLLVAIRPKGQSMLQLASAQTLRVKTNNLANMDFARKIPAPTPRNPPAAADESPRRRRRSLTEEEAEPEFDSTGQMRRGTRVKIHGLPKALKLNGCEGVIAGSPLSTNTGIFLWPVLLDGESEPRNIRENSLVSLRTGTRVRFNDGNQFGVIDGPATMSGNGKALWPVDAGAGRGKIKVERDKLEIATPPETGPSSVNSSSEVGKSEEVESVHSTRDTVEL